MLCSHCSKESTGEFCSSCGAPMEPAKLETESTDVYIPINNVTVNLSEILRKSNGKIDAIRILRSQTGVNLKDAKDVMDQV